MTSARGGLERNLSLSSVSMAELEPASLREGSGHGGTSALNLRHARTSPGRHDRTPGLRDSERLKPAALVLQPGPPTAGRTHRRVIIRLSDHSSSESSGQPASARLHKSPETCRVLVPTAPGKEPKWEPDRGLAGNQSSLMLPTPPLGGLMWGGKSGFLKAGEGAAGNWGPPRVLPLHRVWDAQLHIELRVQHRPRVRQPRPPALPERDGRASGWAAAADPQPSSIACSCDRGALSRELEALGRTRRPRHPRYPRHLRPDPPQPPRDPAISASARLTLAQQCGQHQAQRPVPRRPPRGRALGAHRGRCHATHRQPGPRAGCPMPGAAPGSAPAPAAALALVRTTFLRLQPRSCGSRPRARPLRVRPLHPPDPPTSGPARGRMEGGCSSCREAPGRAGLGTQGGDQTTRGLGILSSRR